MSASMVDPSGAMSADEGGSPCSDRNSPPPASSTAAENASSAGPNANVPKPKRLACMICRKRKLKCDGIKPSCSTCARLGHSCAYDEVRKKSGPKRGYVKALEERLKQVEKLLNTQDTGLQPAPEPAKATGLTFESTTAQSTAAAAANFSFNNPSIAITGDRDHERRRLNKDSPQTGSVDEFNFNSNIQVNMDNSFTWEMIGLGLEEPLPPQETIDDLHQIFFDKVHPSLPMIHKYRYLAAMNLAPAQRPPVALRYATWTLASAITEKYADLKELFYQRARKYLEADSIKGFGEHMISVSHAQTHVLLASYEFKMMYFPRAWMSTGAAVRLCQMMGLHRLDGNGLDVKQCLPPPRDWTEREERRRTFWMAFCEDRYASIGTGWPMTIDERDILTQLPASEEAFNMSKPEKTQPLSDSMTPSGAGKLSSFGGIVLMACLFGRNLIHLHRPDDDDRDHDLHGQFWKRHRDLDNILLNTSLCLPVHLKLPVGLQNPNIVFTNMNIHTSTICLHQAAIFKADKNRLPASFSAESKVRCITAANEIASIMRMVSHMDLSAMNPFISFCLYVAARVFVQYLKSRPDDSQTADSLRFLLAAMNALKRKNPLTESFLVQLDVDLEALGVRIPKLRSAFPRSTDSPSTSHMPPKLSHQNQNSRACEGGEAGAGILRFRDDTNFGPPESDGVRNSAAEADNHNRGTGARQTSTEYGSQDWQRMPTRERNFSREENYQLDGTGFAQMHFSRTPGSYGENGSSGETNSPNPDSQSNRPTPNSSSASDHRQSVSGTGPMNTSGRTSFDASPIGSSRNLGPDSSAANFFQSSMANGFQMPGGGGGGGGGGGTGMTPGRTFATPDPSSNEFTMTDGWQLPGQSETGMTPVAQGVLQHLMSMPPMDTMDLGWDSGS